MNLFRKTAWILRARADAWATSADGRRAALYGGEEYATARGVDEALARLTVEPRKDGGADVHILSNAYDAPGFTPFARWFREGLGRLVDQKKFPAVLGDSGLQLSSSTWQNKPGMRIILTEKHLDGYRRKNSPADMSRTVQPLRTPAATIRAAITKAYGKLLGQLESKGFVTLTQTEDEAIEAAARARADKTGQPLAEVRASLMGSVSNSKRVTRDVRAVLSQADMAGTDVVEVKFGTVDPALANLIQSKTRKDVGGFEHSMDSSAVRHARNEHGDARQEAARGQIAITDDDLRTAPQVIFSADRYVLGAKDRQGNDLVGYVKQMPDGTVLYVEEVRTGRKTLAFKSIRKYAATSNVDAVAKTLSLNARSDGGISIVDARSLDIKRSSNGVIQGFFDPQTGQSFLIADNLTAEAAPGVLMHEVGIHMAADGSMKALFNRAAMMLKMQRGNPFMKAVQARMDAAGETSGEEAAAYIAEAYENNRANAPASVQRWLADLLAAVKAWMFKKGIVGADSLTVADIAAVARANARSMARDGGATGGQGFGPAFSVGEEVARSGGVAPMSPSPGKTPLYEAFRQLARFGEAFQLRGSNAADLADIAREMQTGKKPQEKFTAGPSTALHRGTRKKTLALYIEGLDGEQHKLLDIFESESARPFVVIGNSEVGQDKGGSHAYQIAFAWAHNNGKTMRPDPAGLTVINRLRRSEALISSALRFGTTRHLEPHADQYIALAPTTRRLGAEPEDTHYGSNPQLHGELAALKEKLWTTGMMPLPLPTMFSILLKPLPRSRDCANPHCATSRSWTEHCATGVWKNRFLWATWRLVSKMQNESSPVSLYSQPVQAWASLLLSATQSQPLSQGPFPMDQLHRLASTRKNTVTSAVSMLRQSGPLGKRWAALMAGRLRD